MSAFLFCFAAWLAMALGMDKHHEDALGHEASPARLRHLRNAGPLNHVGFDAKLRVLQQALGTHTRRTQVQGARLKTRREIRVATLFREAPAALLRMIVVHELAHLRELDHNKAFYQLCQHMEPEYFQLEFDLRLYLMNLEHPASDAVEQGAA